MKISIITVVKNDKHNIEKTIQSCISQRHINIEYIVINGLSTDGTNEIIDKYSDKIHKYINDYDIGIYDAMNKGLDLATGDWIIFMNSGDIFYQDITLYNIFLNNLDNFAIIAGSWIENSNPELKFNANNFIKYGMIACHQAILVKTEILKKYKFSINYIISSDFDFFSKIRLNKNNKTYIYPNVISIISPIGLGRNSKLYYKEYLKIIYNNFGFYSYCKYRLHHFISNIFLN